MWQALLVAGMAALNGYNSTRSQNAQLRYQAATSRINAQLANMQAEFALRQGERQQQISMVNTEKMKGAQKAAYAANGIDLSSRSVNNVLTETDLRGWNDQHTAEVNALENSWTSRMNATNYENQALMAEAQTVSPWQAALGSGLSVGLKNGLVSSAMDAAKSGISSLFKQDVPLVYQKQYIDNPTLLGGAKKTKGLW